MAAIDDKALRLLKSLYEKGRLTEEQYRAELTALGVDPMSQLAWLVSSG